jgi:hypothetical protein
MTDPGAKTWFRQRVLQTAAELESAGHSVASLSPSLDQVIAEEIRFTPQWWGSRSRCVVGAALMVVGAVCFACALLCLVLGLFFMASQECDWPEWDEIERASSSVHGGDGENPWAHRSSVCSTFMWTFGAVGVDRLNMVFGALSMGKRWKRDQCFPGYVVRFWTHFCTRGCHSHALNRACMWPMAFLSGVHFLAG